ncbi:MAG: hypothetical protein WEC41_00740, partial [Dongiaceae bacterium]
MSRAIGLARRKRVLPLYRNFPYHSILVPEEKNTQTSPDGARRTRRTRARLAGHESVPAAGTTASNRLGTGTATTSPAKKGENMGTDIGALTVIFTEFYYWVTVFLMFLI